MLGSTSPFNQSSQDCFTKDVYDKTVRRVEESEVSINVPKRQNMNVFVSGRGTTATTEQRLLRKPRPSVVRRPLTNVQEKILKFGALPCPPWSPSFSTLKCTPPLSHPFYKNLLVCSVRSPLPLFVLCVFIPLTTSLPMLL